jgi:hypothetical protein
MIWVLRITQMLVNMRILKIDIGNIHILHLLFVCLGITLSVCDIARREFLEFHDILRESTCLVREHKVNSAQLLIQIG